MKFYNAIKRLFKDDKGLSAMEYAILLAVIGVGVVTALTTLDGTLQGKITASSDEILAD